MLLEILILIQFSKNMGNKNNRDYWNNWGAEYSQVWQNAAKQKLSEKELTLIKKYLNIRKPQQILDIGVGNGRILENIIAYSNEKSEIFGIDISDNMVNICCEKFKKCAKIKGIEVCDVSQTEICFDNSFDFITAIRVLKYNRNWPDILERTYKKLDKEGIFIFTMPNKQSVAGLKEDTFSKNKIAINYTNKKQLEIILSRLGYKLCEIVGFSRVPNTFYDFSNNKLYVKILLGLEKVLEIIFGKSFLVRYFLVVCKK
jgi:ubiquinone/menaquinone biosynthesis C-methylase UbiE